MVFGTGAAVAFAVEAAVEVAVEVAVEDGDIDEDKDGDDDEDDKDVQEDEDLDAGRKADAGACVLDGAGAGETVTAAWLAGYMESRVVIPGRFTPRVCESSACGCGGSEGGGSGGRCVCCSDGAWTETRLSGVDWVLD